MNAFITNPDHTEEDESYSLYVPRQLSQEDELLVNKWITEGFGGSKHDNKFKEAV